MNIDFNALLTLIVAHKWIALAAVLVGLVVRLLKEDVPPAPLAIPARWRPFAALGLGQVAAALEAVASGTAWKDAAVGGLVAAALAILGHDTLIEGLRGGKEIGGSSTPTLGLLLVLAGGLTLGGAGCSASDRKTEAAIAKVAAPMACKLVDVLDGDEKVGELCDDLAPLIPKILAERRAMRAHAADAGADGAP